MAPKRRRTDLTPYAWDLDPEAVKRERSKARELRHSQWWKRQIAKGRCHYCGADCPPSALTMDHVVPVSRGGRSTKGNLVPCCKNCNAQKKQLLPTDWALYLDRMRSKATGR
jgi:5-methylcytosine-specific restriction protein A